MMQRGHKGGFTLLEVLIATGILALGLVTIFTLFPIGILAVKDVVDGTRSVNLARTARSEMASGRADMRIMDSLSHHYDGYMQAGPWEVPSDVGTFRDCVYEYLYTDAGTGVTSVRRRIMFDDRRMVPIPLMGTIAGGTITIDPTSLNRDADRLIYYCEPRPTAAAPTTTFGDWDIYAKMQGHIYRITPISGSILFPDSIGYDPANPRDLKQFTVDDTGFPLAPTTQPMPLQILFPVAMKEPPIDVPQEWAGGTFASIAAGGTGVLDPAGVNGSLARYCCVNGWVDIGGDWFQMINVNRDANGIPTDIAFRAPLPAATTGATNFGLILPVVTFDDSFSGDKETLTILAPGGGVRGGGGPQLSMLETGAEIEIVLGGGYGIFDPAINGRTITDIKANQETAAHLTPGNFVRVGGRDYCIVSRNIDTSVSPATGDVTLDRPVPSLGSEGVYFEIVIGCGDPSVAANNWQYRRPARFPVVGLNPPGVAGHLYTSIEVGRDANGYLPTNVGMGGGVAAPIHVLPRNPSQFSYSVALSQKELEGVFAGTTVTSTLGDFPVQLMDPSWLTDASGTYMFRLHVLSSPLLNSSYRAQELFDALPTALTISAAVPGITPPTRSFHVIDTSNFGTEILEVGSGAFDGISTVTILPIDITFPDNERLLAKDVYVDIIDAGGTVSNARITGVTYAAGRVSGFTLDSNPGGLAAGTVTIRVAQTGAAAGPNWPRGTGAFVQGSEYVTPTADSPGFPICPDAPKRYNLAIGDFIKAPDSVWYAVKAIDTTAGSERVILDRAYAGTTTADYSFAYVSALPEAYASQTAVYRNYKVASLTGNTDRSDAAVFYTYTEPTTLVEIGKVKLSKPLPRDVKPGDYIRADGDASHNAISGPADPGLGDNVDGDWQWYMIDRIERDPLTGIDRGLITLTTVYRGYYDTANPAGSPRQPASISTSLLKTYDTIMGAF